MLLFVKADIYFYSFFSNEKPFKRKIGCFRGYSKILHNETVIGWNLWQNIGAPATRKAMSLPLHFKAGKNFIQNLSIFVVVVIFDFCF